MNQEDLTYLSIEALDNLYGERWRVTVIRPDSAYATTDTFRYEVAYYQHGHTVPVVPHSAIGNRHPGNVTPEGAINFAGDYVEQLTIQRQEIEDAETEAADYVTRTRPI
jgi:hypothetical protein